MVKLTFLEDLLRRRSAFARPLHLAHTVRPLDRRLRKGEVDRLFLIFRHLDAFDLVELLDAALHLLGLGRLCAEAIDEGFKVLDALALVLDT